MNLKRLLGDRLFTAFASWAIRRALRTPYTHLRQADGRPYIDRSWLARIGGKGPDDEYPLIGVRVHHIQSSDADCALHDHPWPFISIILFTGYTEIRPADQTPDLPWVFMRVGGKLMAVSRQRYVAGDVLFRRASDWHMIEIPEGASAVTIFITLRKVQSWGFLWRGAKIPWRDFAAEKGCGNGIADVSEPGGDLRKFLPEYRDAT